MPPKPSPLHATPPSISSGFTIATRSSAATAAARPPTRPANTKAASLLLAKSLIPIDEREHIRADVAAELHIEFARDALGLV